MNAEANSRRRSARARERLAAAASHRRISHADRDALVGEEAASGSATCPVGDPTAAALPDGPSGEWLTVRQFCRKHEAWTEPSLRWLIFVSTSPSPKAVQKESPNLAGLKKAFAKVGRRRLVHEGRFLQWLEESCDDQP